MCQLIKLQLKKKRGGGGGYSKSKRKMRQRNHKIRYCSSLRHFQGKLGDIKAYGVYIEDFIQNGEE